LYLPRDAVLDKVKREEHRDSGMSFVRVKSVLVDIEERADFDGGLLKQRCYKKFLKGLP
jgi:hypothetical protein